MRMRMNTRVGRSFRPTHISLLSSCVAAAMAMAMVPAAAQAQNGPAGIPAALQTTSAVDRDIRAFYETRGYRPLWIEGSSLGPQAERLLQLVENAHLDGLDTENYRPRDLAAAVQNAWGGSAEALAEAEMLLSQTLVAYVRDVRRAPEIDMLFVDKALAPTPPSASAVLEAASAAPSLATYLENTAWMHPLYSQLRKALADYDGSEQRLLRLNLERARALPAFGQRHILVDAAAARLWLYEDGRPVDSMKVVVGKTSEATPMMAALIRYAMVNPYWYVPPDLVQGRIAPSVLDQGLGYLKTKRYEVLSDWSPDATIVDPSTVDWKAVAAGREELPVRQRPGSDNAMGKMKFMFPNERGVYLHDTPERHLFAEDARRFSSGCVRLEDAPRLAKWLFGEPLNAATGTPEQRVDLPQAVPVYITYLTAAPEDGRIAFRDDPYHRDATQMARLGSRIFTGR